MHKEIFQNLGGKFITAPPFLKNKLHNIKALLFDWDGVFNSGEKGEIPSSFNEADSMGINMLRFGYYLLLGNIPYTAIITGETNQTAFKWAKREHLDHVYYQVKHKADLIDELRKNQGIEADQILFAFDDILDLSLAKEAGARFLVNRNANPLFKEFCVKKKLCDYITFSTGDQAALREISEVVLNALGKFEATIEGRMDFEGIYQQFLKERQIINTQYKRSFERGFVDKDYESLT